MKGIVCVSESDIKTLESDIKNYEGIKILSIKKTEGALTLCDVELEFDSIGLVWALSEMVTTSRIVDNQKRGRGLQNIRSIIGITTLKEISEKSAGNIVAEYWYEWGDEPHGCVTVGAKFDNTHYNLGYVKRENTDDLPYHNPNK